MVFLRQHPLQAHTVNPTHVFLLNCVTFIAQPSAPPDRLVERTSRKNWPGLFGDNKCLTKSLATGEGLPRIWKSPLKVFPTGQHKVLGPWLMG